MQSKTEPRKYNDSAYPELEKEFDISHDDIEKAFHDFVKEEDKQKPPRERGLVNTLSVFGGVMMVVTMLLGLQLLGLEVGPDISFTRHVIGPSLIALVVLLLWSGTSKKKSRKKNSKQAPPQLKVRRDGASASARSAFEAGSTKDGEFDEYAFSKKKRLLRSSKDKKFLGVCGGIADYFGFDPTVVRILFGLSMAFYGTPILLYFLLAIIMKKEPKK